MKKIFLIIIVFMFIEVHALNEKTHYTEYSDYIDGYNEPSDLVELFKYDKYKYYNISTSKEDYFIYNENPSDYPNIDLNDSIVTPFIDSFTIMPDDKPNRVIKSNDIYYYQDMKEIRYIFLYDVLGSYGALKIGEIEIYAGIHKISPDLTCSSCTNVFLNSVNNNEIKYMEASHMYNKSYLMIDLNDYYPVDSITFKMFVYDISNNANTYSLAFTKEASLETKYVDLTSSFYYRSSSVNDLLLVEHNINNMNIDNPEYYDQQISFDPVANSITRKINVEKQYTYSDTLYRYYDEKKVYSDDFLLESTSDFPFQSLESEEFFKYKTRDKIIIKYPLVINNNETIEDMVIFSSDEYDILIDDYSKNGIYDVKFVINDSVFEEQLVVDKAKIPIKTNSTPVVTETTQNEDLIPDNVDTTHTKLKLDEEKNEDSQILKMIAVPFMISFLIPTYIYFKSEFNKV